MGSFEATIVKNSQCFQVIVRCVWQLSCIFIDRTAENSPSVTALLDNDLSLSRGKWRCSMLPNSDPPTQP